MDFDNTVVWGGGVSLHTPLVVRPQKKLFFMCVFPKLSVLVKYCKKSVIFSEKMFPCEV